MKQALGEDVDVYLAAWNYESGLYKRYIERTLKNFCETLYWPANKEFFEDYQAHTTHPVAWNTCPYPKGSNRVINYQLSNYEKFLPPYLPGGEKWKGEIKFSRDGVVLGGYNIFGTLSSNYTLLNSRFG